MHRVYIDITSHFAFVVCSRKNLVAPKFNEEFNIHFSLFMTQSCIMSIVDNLTNPSPSTREETNIGEDTQVNPASTDSKKCKKTNVIKEEIVSLTLKDVVLVPD